MSKPQKSVRTDASNPTDSTIGVLHAKRKSEIALIRQKFLDDRRTARRDQIGPIPVISLSNELYELELLDFESFLDEELEQRGDNVADSENAESMLKIECLAGLIDNMVISYPKEYVGPLWDKLYHLITPVKIEQNLIMFYKEKIYAWACLRDLHRTLLDMPSLYVMLNATVFNQPLLLKSKLTYLADWIYWRETQSLAGGIILRDSKSYEQLMVACVFKLKYESDYLYRDKSKENIVRNYSHFGVNDMLPEETDAPANLDDHKLCEQQDGYGNSITTICQMDFIENLSGSSDDDQYYTPACSFTHLAKSSSTKVTSKTAHAVHPNARLSQRLKMPLSTMDLSTDNTIREADFTKENFSFKAGTLIICQRALVKKWEQEAMRKLYVCSFTDTLPTDWELNQICSYECIIMACELLQTDNFDWGQLLIATWTRIIVDDALALCREQQIWYNVCLLNAYSYFAITNVPLQEFHVDLLSIFRYLKWPAWNFSKIWSMLITDNNSLSEQLYMVLQPVVFNFKKIGVFHAVQFP